MEKKRSQSKVGCLAQAYVSTYTCFGFALWGHKDKLEALTRSIIEYLGRHSEESEFIALAKFVEIEDLADQAFTSKQLFCGKRE